MFIVAKVMKLKQLKYKGMKVIYYRVGIIKIGEALTNWLL